MKLAGKAVLVTGGAKRIGRAIALSLARRGMHVAIHYNHSAKEAAALAKGLSRAHGVRCIAVKGELADPRVCARIPGEAARGLGSLDVLINNASVYDSSRFGATTADDWDRQLDVNARAPFLITQAAAPYLRKGGRGKVVNIADWSAHRPYVNYIPYCVSKAALLCLNTALAKALAPQIQVNAVMPGPVLEPEGQSAAVSEAVRKATLLKRLGSPEDVVKAVLFLLESDFATGASIAVDGGRLIA